VLGDRLGVASLFAPTERRWWRDSFGNGLLTRVPIESWRRIPLASPGGSGHRNLLLAEVRVGDARVRVLTTHLDRQRPREGQLRAAIGLFRQLDPPAVLLGDLNTTATDPVLQELVADPTVANPLRAHVPDLPAGHIDWIFARGLISTAAGVGPVDASDHPLVWAEFVLP
jgi:endonuclease/exonuclease/phosphatase family metal-dependent hydrolase